MECRGVYMITTDEQPATRCIKATILKHLRRQILYTRPIISAFMCFSNTRELRITLFRPQGQDLDSRICDCVSLGIFHGILWEV